MIASALTHDPPLLILDEPTSALDVSVQAQIMNLLKELKAERGMAMLFITHDLALASDLCDRLGVVYAGQIRELGSADDVLRSPQDPYTRALLGSIPSLHADRAPEFLPGAPPDLRTPPPACRFQPRCPVAFEPCDRLPPSLVEARPDQWARCWLHDASWRSRLGQPVPAGEHR
jgi:oligopeptide/dipeptide ABC transporter ATP-binding protein